MNSSGNQSFRSAPSKLVVLGTGGTIAGRSPTSGDNVGYTAGQICAADLLFPLNDLLPQSVKSLDVSVEQLAQLDSKDMDDATWAVLAHRVRQLAADDSVAGVLITHGTDTLEETAFWLTRVVQTDKPIVLTCAMRPATALSPDGPQNLLDALTVATEPNARGGVWVVAAGAIHHPIFLSKVHPYRVDAFESLGAGVAGWVEEGAVRWMRPCEDQGSQAPFSELRLDGAPWPRVDVLFSHAGVDDSLLCAVLNDEKAQRPLRGLIVAGTGNGTIHREWVPLLQDAQSRGLMVWRTSRCSDGLVVDATQNKDALPSIKLPPFKARIEMLLNLMQRDQVLLQQK
jgi:L-asparaginase